MSVNTKIKLVGTTLICEMPIKKCEIIHINEYFNTHSVLYLHYLRLTCVIPISDKDHKV